MRRLPLLAWGLLMVGAWTAGGEPCLDENWEKSCIVGEQFSWEEFLLTYVLNPIHQTKTGDPCVESEVGPRGCHLMDSNDGSTKFFGCVSNVSKSKEHCEIPKCTSYDYCDSTWTDLDALGVQIKDGVVQVSNAQQLVTAIRNQTVTEIFFMNNITTAPHDLRGQPILVKQPKLVINSGNNFSWIVLTGDRPQRLMVASPGTNTSIHRLVWVGNLPDATETTEKDMYSAFLWSHLMFVLEGTESHQTSLILSNTSVLLDSCEAFMSYLDFLNEREKIERCQTDTDPVDCSVYQSIDQVYINWKFETEQDADKNKMLIIDTLLISCDHAYRRLVPPPLASEQLSSPSLELEQWPSGSKGVQITNAKLITYLALIACFVLTTFSVIGYCVFRTGPRRTTDAPQVTGDPSDILFTVTISGKSTSFTAASASQFAAQVAETFGRKMSSMYDQEYDSFLKPPQDPDGVFNPSTSLHVVRYGEENEVIKENMSGSRTGEQILTISTSTYLNDLKNLVSEAPADDSPVPSDSFSSEYKVIRDLFKSDRCLIQLVEHKATGEQHVMKIANSAAVKDTIQEAFFAQFLKHPHLVDHKQTVVHKGLLAVLVEYCDLGDLQTLVDTNVPCSESFVTHVLFQMANALNYLHVNNIVHRDIKPANIMLSSSGLFKVGDFGLSRVTLNTCESFVGTPVFMAPELILGEPYAKEVDIFALGATLYVLCMMRLPFTSLDLEELQRQKTQATYEPIPTDRYSKDLVELIDSMLSVDPSERPTAAEICKLSWVREFCMKPETQTHVEEARKLLFGHMGQMFQEGYHTTELAGGGRIRQANTDMV